MPESIARLIDVMDALEAPVAHFALDGRIRYANDACWRNIFEITDVQDRIPGLDYFALAFVGLHSEPARNRLRTILATGPSTVLGETAIGGSRWQICLCRYRTDLAEGVFAWHCRLT